MSELHTRKEKRTPVTLKIKFKSATLDQFIERYSVDVSQGGIFIRTKDPLAVGTQLRFEFQLQDASPLISGDGTVVWTREFDPSRTGVAPGMGVRFDRLLPESQGVLEQILIRKSGGKVPDSLDTPAVMMQDKTRITPQTLVNSLASQSRPSVQQPAIQVDKPILPKGLTGLVPPRGGFSDEPSKDQTPLPKPMPFHVGTDEEFSEDVFEQPTKVASLELLLKHEEEQARAAQAEAARKAAMTAAAELEDDEQTAVTLNRSVRHLPEAVIVPSAPEPVPVPLVAAMSPAPVPASAGSEPAFVQNAIAAAASRAPSGERRAVTSPRPAVSLPDRRPPSGERRPAPVGVPLGSGRAERAPISAPRISVPQRGGTPVPTFIVEKRSAMPYVLGAGVLLAAAVALYLFVIRGDETPPSRPQLVKKSPPPEQPPPPAPVPIPTPAAAVAPAASKVAVAVSSTPLAHVVVDGVARGQTPTTVNDLDAGKTYEIVLSAACYKTEKRQITPSADHDGRDGEVNVKMTPLERVVHVKSDPPSAIVLVDGKPAGRTPADVRLVGKLDARAPHTFLLRRPGFEDAQTTVSPDSPCATEGDSGAMGLTISLTPLRRAAPEAPARPSPQKTEAPAAKPAPPPQSIIRIFAPSTK